jgi:hypothetical protein
VRDGAFHGRGYDYVIQLGDGLLLTGVFDRRRFDRGAAVDLFIHPAGTLVFADEEEREAPTLVAEAVVRSAAPETIAQARPSAPGASGRPVAITLRDNEEN